MLRAILGPVVVASHADALCAWLRVPPGWTEDGLVRALAAHGIAVTASEPFIAGGERPAGGMRVCIGGHYTRAHLRGTFERMRATFAQLPPVFDAGSDRVTGDCHDPIIRLTCPGGPATIRADIGSGHAAARDGARNCRIARRRRRGLIAWIAAPSGLREIVAAAARIEGHQRSPIRSAAASVLTTA